MIHIEINEKQISEIKALWSKWFFKSDRMKQFMERLEKDNNFRSFFFKNAEDYYEWVDKYFKCSSSQDKCEWQKPIVEYFFKDLSGKNIAEKYKQPLETNTEAFLLRSYNSYRSSYTLPRIIDIINVQVCPYCNRNFMERYSLKKNGSNQSYFKGDLDHHYSKDEIPALMLSFYNLIPCCKVCNHEKGNSGLRPFHPYYDYEEKEYRFSVEVYTEEDKKDIIHNMLIDDIESKRFDSTVWQGISDNFKIILKGIDETELNDCIKNSNTLFKLEKKYNHSKDYVKELIRKKYIYPKIRKEELLKNFPDIFKDKTDLYETFYSFVDNPEQIRNRPLAKLTKDILEQIRV